MMQKTEGRKQTHKGYQYTNNTNFTNNTSLKSPYIQQEIKKQNIQRVPNPSQSSSQLSNNNRYTNNFSKVYQQQYTHYLGFEKNTIVAPQEAQQAPYQASNTTAQNQNNQQKSLKHFNQLQEEQTEQREEENYQSKNYYPKHQQPPVNYQPTNYQHNNYDNTDNNNIKKNKKEMNKKNRTSNTHRHSKNMNSTSTPDAKRITKTQQQQKKRKTISYNAERVVGTGSFGVVYLAKVEESDEVVAIKKVLQDRRYKNRELQMMKMVNHRNVVKMKHCFFNKGERNGVYLHLVLEYIPDTVHNFCKSFTKKKQYMPLTYVKLFTYQMLRSLNYIHSMSVCHRDIKPQNLLVDPVSGVLKLCDFGSAKQLQKGEPNVAYICSRFYRAPELIFGATHYTTAIDVWSAGCVLGELLLGEPLFPGESSLDQIVEIMRVLGKPDLNDLGGISSNFATFQFPNVKTMPWRKIYEKRLNLGFPLPEEALNLLNRMLLYNPRKRPSAIDLLVDPFFDDLRKVDTRLPSGKQLPEIFDFTVEELKMLSHEYSRNDLVPNWYRQRLHS